MNRWPLAKLVHPTDATMSVYYVGVRFNSYIPKESFVVSSGIYGIEKRSHSLEGDKLHNIQTYLCWDFSWRPAYEIHQQITPIVG